MSIKQVIVVRKDLNMPCGKLMAQAAHASLSAITNRMYTETENVSEDLQAIYRELNCLSNSALNIWLTGEQKKVVLAVNSKEELDALYAKASELKMICSYIIDNGHTIFNGVQTPTCIAIGPDWEEDINTLTGHLKLY